MILSEEELKEINAGMLRVGAPVEIDGVGYNKIHFSLMNSLYSMSTLTLKQKTAMVRVMKVYANTQLKAYAQDLYDTLEALENYKEPIKNPNLVEVVEYDKETVSIKWKFNREISNFIKNSSRKNYKYNVINGEWILKLFWDRSDEYISKFRELQYDTTQISVAKQKANEVVLKDANGNTIEFYYEAIVERTENSIDTLDLKINHHPVIAEYIRRTPDISFEMQTSTYTFRIDTSSILYENLKSCKKSIDLSQLLPWKNLVDSWKSNHEMIDLSKMNLKFKPYDFQPLDIKEMLKSKVVLNANDMGCGKTFESVVTGESLPMKKLVICPATLRLNWEAEIRMVNPDADICVLYSDKIFDIGNDWTIIGYPSLGKFQSELERENFQCIFIDEAHYCQAVNSSGNPDSIRARVTLRLAATSEYVFPLTGTPKTNRNKNLYNILRLIRHPLAKSTWSYMDYGVAYCDGFRGAYGWDFEGNSNDNELNEKLKPYMIRHLKKEVLPDLTKQRLIVPVRVDLKEYDSEISEYLNKRTNKEAEHLARLMRARLILAKQKAGETVDFVKEIINSGDKVVVVTCFTEVVKIMESNFGSKMVKLTGGMSDEQKQASKQEFQEGATPIMVMNIIAGGVGVTLTASHIMVFNDYDFVPGNVIQAEDRICRGGQTECCMIHYITAKGADVEEDFVDLLTYKTGTINDTIDGGEGEAINFRNLVEKSAGNERSDKIRKVLSSDPTYRHENKNKSSVSKTNKSSIDFSKMSMEEIESQIRSLGGEPKIYDNPAITRMRMVMLLKKLI